MRNRITTAAVAALAAFGLSFGVAAQQKPAAAPIKVTVYKSPT